MRIIANKQLHCNAVSAPHQVNEKFAGVQFVGRIADFNSNHFANETKPSKPQKLFTVLVTGTKKMLYVGISLVLIGNLVIRIFLK